MAGVSDSTLVTRIRIGWTIGSGDALETSLRRGLNQSQSVQYDDMAVLAVEWMGT